MQASIVFGCAFVALFGAGARALAIAEGDYHPFCDDEFEKIPGRTSAVEYGCGLEQTYDCIRLGERGSIMIYRYLPTLRRVAKVQTINSPELGDTTETRWLQITPVIDSVSVSLTDKGLAVGEDGKALFVTSSNSAEVVVFDRKIDTGRLSVRGTRAFPSEAERTTFLDALRKDWDANRRARDERRRECPH